MVLLPGIVSAPFPGELKAKLEDIDLLTSSLLLELSLDKIIALFILAFKALLRFGNRVSQHFTRLLAQGDKNALSSPLKQIPAPGAIYQLFSIQVIISWRVSYYNHTFSWIEL